MSPFSDEVITWEGPKARFDELIAAEQERDALRTALEAVRAENERLNEEYLSIRDGYAALEGVEFRADYAEARLTEERERPSCVACRAMHHLHQSEDAHASKPPKKGDDG